MSEFGEDQYLVMLTVNGYIKKVPLNAFSSIRSSGIISIQLVYPLMCLHLLHIAYFWVIVKMWYNFLFNNWQMLGSW